MAFFDGIPVIQMIDIYIYLLDYLSIISMVRVYAVIKMTVSYLSTVPSLSLILVLH